MKKTFGQKLFIIAAMIAILLALVGFSMAALKPAKLTPCENNPDHFTDEDGNSYCIAAELVDSANAPPPVPGSKNPAI